MKESIIAFVVTLALVKALMYVWQCIVIEAESKQEKVRKRESE